MKWALLADVHANLEALRAVLAELDTLGEVGIVCAGDLVGYGPDPTACLDLLIERDILCIQGNHDGMLLGKLPLNRCPHAAIEAILWQRRRISPAHRRWIASLPLTLALPPHLMVCHGNLDDPCHYLATPHRAEDALQTLATRHPDRRLLVCGHTHHPVLYQQGMWHAPQNSAWQALIGRVSLLNPGSVGQARDGVPVARYALYDSEREAVSFRTVSYDHARTQAKLRSAGLKARVVMPRERRRDSRLDRLRLRWLLWREKKERVSDETQS